MRLKSEIFVSALIRLAETQGAIAVLRRRGAQEAGAIFIKLDCLDGRMAVYGPAAQSERLLEGVDRLLHGFIKNRGSKALMQKHVSVTR